MDEIVAAIDRYSAAEGCDVYVHDANGIGRVGTAIGCWIGSRPGIARDPIGFLDELRREIDGPWWSSPSLPEQRAFVRRYSHARGQAGSEDVEGGSR
jgi:protein-tyrosine phosphatase